MSLYKLQKPKPSTLGSHHSVRVVSVSESMMGRRRAACLGGSDYYCQLGSASVVLHVLSDMQHEEFESSLSWEYHGSSSALLFNGAVKTSAYQRHGRGLTL